MLMVLTKAYSKYFGVTNRWQSTKIDTAFSSWTEITRGVLKGSIIGAIPFKLFLKPFFFYFLKK